MINKDYRKSALLEYGEACEICGHRTSLEVHHIDYQEHQLIENKLRKARGDEFLRLVGEAKKLGYDAFNSNQLSKNDDTENLSVLCANHHGLIHLLDVGKLLLNAIPPRR